MGDEGRVMGNKESYIGKIAKDALKLSAEKLARSYGLSYEKAVEYKILAQNKKNAEDRATNLAKGIQDPRDHGTKHTRKYRLSCPIFRMLKRGQIGADEYAAADAICRGYRLRNGEVSIGQFRYEERTTVGWSDGERLADAVAEQRYVAWVGALKTTKIKYNVIRDAIVFGKPLRDCEDFNNIKHGTAREMVQKALSLYCKMRVPTAEAG